MLTQTWTATEYCKTHGIEYEVRCSCTDPDWCDCFECPLCDEEESVELIRNQRDSCDCRACRNDEVWE